ncbi:ash family protein [Salmonella enterica subsp. enterica]|nr:ash family protein [Salmonella enterica subsp. enterica]EIE2853947.1 ash family protein [Salmonella enterica]EEN1742251.1 ash family protein [Salmonella enterica subsp. enterica]EEN8834483.1 ash family protein [Salmonella enterica subsp. enterica]EEN9618754.1 ash family protein [Salmonella enterica subsp. enterica]
MFNNNHIPPIKQLCIGKRVAVLAFVGCVFVWIKGDFHVFIVATKNVFANLLHWLAVLSYAYPAPHKAGAGRCNPCKYKATPDAVSVFFVVRYTRHSMAWCAHLMAGCSQAPDHATAHRAALIMVTLAGQPQGWPVPLYAGIATPVNVTALFERCNSSGDSLNLYKEAVYHG